MGVLSPNNQSRPFDDLADGYGRAEGIGALLLKPLSAAIRDGDPVRSVIRSTAATR
jgi:acyl transferase domain-containing protein